jgi:hypothetical protein
MTTIEAELLQAVTDYVADVPGAWERYCYWLSELEYDEYVRAGGDERSGSCLSAAGSVFPVP